MGWHHPQSGWVFQLNQTFLETITYAYPDLCFHGDSKSLTVKVNHFGLGCYGQPRPSRAASEAQDSLSHSKKNSTLHGNPRKPTGAGWDPEQGTRTGQLPVGTGGNAKVLPMLRSCCRVLPPSLKVQALLPGGVTLSPSLCCHQTCTKEENERGHEQGMQGPSSLSLPLSFPPPPPSPPILPSSEPDGREENSSIKEACLLRLLVFRTLPLCHLPGGRK